MDRIRETSRLATVAILALAAAAVGVVESGVAHAYTAKGVGVVTALRGGVGVTHAPPVAAREGRPPQEALKFKDDVFFQDVIDTQRDSIAKLLLRGRSTFTIRELSRVELREGVVPADPTRTRSIVSLLTGAFRAIIQRDLRPQDEFEIRTPNAISAVRGSDLVVEVYAAGTTPPPLPSAGLEPEDEIRPVGYDLAQLPLALVVARWFVREGEVTVEGVTARALQGIEKIGNLPPRLFSFVPDYFARLLARFLPIAHTQPPLPVQQAQELATLQSLALALAGGARLPALGAPGPSSVERGINSLTLAMNREVTFNEQVSGLGTFGSSSPTSFTFDPSFNPGRVTFSLASGNISPGSFSPESSATFGSVSGTARILGSGPSTVTLFLDCSGFPVIKVTLFGNFTIIGNRLFGTGSGQGVCLSGCPPSTRFTVTFR